MLPDPIKIERILVRGTNWIGDAVMSTPALGRLRSSFPHSHITLLAPSRTAELFEDSSYFDEILVYRRREKGVKALFEAAASIRASDCDLAVLFQNAFEAALLAWIGRVPLRVGYATQGRTALLTHRLYRGPEHRNRHQIHDYLDLVSECERIGSNSNPRFHSTLKSQSSNSLPSLTASAKQKGAARDVLQRMGVDRAAGALVVLNVGATNSRAKCWPEERFAALADRLIDCLKTRVVLIGAASERGSAQCVIDRMKHRDAVNLAGATTIGELVGLLDSSDLLISNDTGPAHITAALGRPTLTIFGPTNEFETAPTGIRAEIIRAEGIECARCMHRDCPIDHRCMSRLSVDDVLARARKLLGAERGT